MGFSYSLHISAKGHAVTNIGKIIQVGKHNLRAYTGKNYDKNLIDTIVGSNNLLSDVEKIYHQEFDDALEKYNAEKRDDRKIHDYLKHVSESRSDVATEIIIQVGDSEFWADKSIEERKLMTEIFRDQIASLNRLCPNFIVANATIHYDEKSPHMHVIGVPVADEYKKGMERQCAKTKVFTADFLSALQDGMRSAAEESLHRLPELFANQRLKPKEKGRNKDIPKEELEEYYRLKEDAEHWQYWSDLYTEQAIKAKDDILELEQEKNFLEQVKEEIDVATCNRRQELSDAVRSLETVKQALSTMQDRKSALQGEIERLEGTKSMANQSVEKINVNISQQKSALLDLQKQVSAANSELSALNKALDEGWAAGVKRYGQTSIMERLNRAKEDVDKDKHLRWLEARVRLLERFVALPQIVPFWEQFTGTVSKDTHHRER